MSTETRAERFGTTSDGRDVEVYTLTNRSGITARIMTYGGVLLSLSVPDRDGNFADVVLGHDTLEEYERARVFFGALIGRYANRIAKGRFTLDGAEYKLATNNGENHLHGGDVGFDRVVWSGEPVDSGVRLYYTSADGEEGYPGTLKVAVEYTLTDADELRIEYSAETDAPTIVNLTNHSYFNLAGQGSPTILDHRLTIFADRFTPVDGTAIPTGELRDVSGTPFDLRGGSAIGERIDDDDEQLRVGGGYDHNWVLNSSGGMVRAASVYEPSTGRVMDVLTTEPGIQFYSGNFLDGSLRGKAGAAYTHRSAFCLETQHFPDSPNQPGFPSTVLRPGEKYSQTTVYRFSAR